MDMFDIDNVKAEKAKAILQDNLLRTIQTFLRVTKLFLLIIFLSWTSSRLPLVFKISGDYFRLLVSIMFNPISVFIIGNIIVLCLLFKSSHLSVHSPITITAEENNEVYQEYFTQKRCLNPIDGGEEMKLLVVEKEEIIYEDKETISEEINNVKDLDHAKNEFVKLNEVGKNLIRCKSENMERVVNVSRKLRRSETEKCKEILNYGEAAAPVVVEEKVHVFDKLSNEEFQKTIEEFIAKQMKFRRAEKVAIVLHSQA